MEFYACWRGADRQEQIKMDGAKIRPVSWKIIPGYCAENGQVWPVREVFGQLGRERNRWPVRQFAKTSVFCDTRRFYLGKSRKISSAPLRPQAPITPPPGWLAAPTR